MEIIFFSFMETGNKCTAISKINNMYYLLTTLKSVMGRTN